jgi:hypothetical protein
METGAGGGRGSDRGSAIRLRDAGHQGFPAIIAIQDAKNCKNSFLPGFRVA